MKEIELKKLFLEYLERKKYVICIEVQFLERKIDVVARKRRKTIAFELKIKNWQKAFQQAVSTKICADYSYIVFFEDYFHRINLELLKKEGLGLLLINEEGKITTKLEPKKSNLINPSLYFDIAQKLDE